MTDDVRMEAIRAQATQLREAMDALALVSEDNWQDWWEPLVDYPLDVQITPTELAIHAREGASRAKAALIILDTAQPLMAKLEEAVYAVSGFKVQRRV